MNTIEGEQGTNSVEKEAIIMIEDANVRRGLRVETIGRKEDETRRGKIDAAAIIENLNEEGGIALVDTMR